MVEIEVADEDGKQLEGHHGIGEFWPGFPLDLEQWIRCHRSLFVPGDFTGFRRSLERLGYEIATPGRYRLRTKYWETDYKSMTDKKHYQEAKKRLIFQWWSGGIESEAVWIEIQP